MTKGAAVAEWLSSWLAEQEDRGSIPRLATWIFRDWLSPASKSRYGWKIAKSTLIKTTNQPTNQIMTKAWIAVLQPLMYERMNLYLFFRCFKLANISEILEHNFKCFNFVSYFFLYCLEWKHSSCAVLLFHIREYLSSLMLLYTYL